MNKLQKHPSELYIVAIFSSICTLYPILRKHSIQSDGVDMNALYGDNIETSELISMDDGWLGDIEFSDNITEEQRVEIQEGIDEEGDHYGYLESNGWTNDDTEAWFYGPLEIIKED